MYMCAKVGTSRNFTDTLDQASKTETLDLCQLPRPPFEIHKMINLPASVKTEKLINLISPPSSGKEK